MRKFLLAAAICGLCMCACRSNSGGYVLDGYIAGNSEGLKVRLFDPFVYPPVILDSAVIHNGKFRLKGCLDYPGMYRLTIDLSGAGEESEMLASDFYLENSPITYRGHIDSLETYYWSNESYRKAPLIEGSAAQDLYVQYQEESEQLEQEYGALSRDYHEVYEQPIREGVFNTDEGIEIAEQMQQVKRQIDSARWKFIEKHAATIVGYDLASQFLEGSYVNLTTGQIDDLAGMISRGWAACPAKADEFKAKAAKAKLMALGAKYQDIELTNTEGMSVKLSEYVPAGKYVMLEFWASWCGPCRAEIPHLRHVYQQYKDKGFEIVSISIDERKADWDKAVREESMVWKQLCDPKGVKGPVNTVYNVQGVPYCIVLDREGRIFKTDMRGASLDALLRELYGQPE